MVYHFFCQLKFCWPRNFIDIFHPTKILSVAFITNNCTLISVSSANKVIKKRSRHWRCSVKEVVPRNFAKLTRKHLCQSLFSNNVVGLGPATLLKKRLWHWCFPVNFEKKLKTSFLENNFRRLLLKRWMSSHFIVSVNRSYWSAEAYLKSCQKFKIERFAKTVNGF